MKKVLPILSLLFLLTQFVFGGKGGPDAYGYTWIDSDDPSGPNFAWWDITAFAGEVQGLGDDNVVGPFSISGFDYYWYTPSLLYVGSNGYVSFGNVHIAATASGFPTIPTTNGLNDIIAPFMTDLNFGGANNNGKVYYFNDPGRDSICVTFENVPFWNAATTFAGSNTFQIILNKADSSITFNYLSQSGTINQPPPTNYVSAGIENITGSIGLQCFLNQYPKDSFTVRFEYPKTVTFQAVDAGIDWVSNERSGGDYIVSGGSGYDLTANVKNFGNTNLSNILLTARVNNLQGTTLLQGTRTVHSLSPGADTTVTFPQSFRASVVSRYTFETEASGITGDLVPSNNIGDVELIAVDTSLTTITLDYSDGFPNGTGISWNGGNGGIGVYIKPPFYPAEISASRFLVQAAGTGFMAMIFDDDGPNGGPGTLLDSVFVDATSVSTTGYTVVTPATGIVTVNSGAVYLLWYMNGTGVTLARDTDVPISGRMYEVLSWTWAEYRDRATEDFLMGLDINQPQIEDMNAALLLSPKAGAVISSPTDVEFTIRNLGNVSIGPGIDLAFQLNADPVVRESYTGAALPPNGATNFKFSQQITAIGGGDLCVWTEHSKDPINSNDSICVRLAGVGIENQELIGLSIYPNPVTDILHFEFPPLATQYRIDVMDMTGKSLIIQNFETKAYHHELNLELSGLSSGYYNLRVIGEKGILKRLITKL